MELIPKYQQGGDTYTVRKGDSPWKISHDNGISLDEFYRLNPFARKMIHPNDIVRLREEPKRKTVYIPRQSVELLEGVTVIAPKKLKPKEQKPLVQKKSKQLVLLKVLQKPDSVKTNSIRKSSNSSSSVLQDSSVIDIIKSKLYNFANDARFKAADMVNKSSLDLETKDDLSGVLSAPTFKQMYDTAVYGLGRKADKIKDKISPVLDTIGEFFDTNGDSIPLTNEEYKALGITPPMSKFEKNFVTVGDSLVNARNLLSGQSYKPSSLDYGSGPLRRNGAPHRYLTHENINLNDVALGVRNRSDKYNNQGLPIGVERDIRPIENTSGIIISSYNPFLEYGHPSLKSGYANMPGINWNYYYGIDKDGNFIHGSDYNQFKVGDILTRSLAHDVTGAFKGKGPYSIHLNLANGKTTPMNMTSSTLDLDKRHRGRELLIAGDEARLVSGSVEDLDREIQSMKQRHGVNSVKLVELDNGSYSEGLRTTTGNLSSSDVDSYIGRNSRNGHFMYINTAIKKKGGPKVLTRKDIPSGDIIKEMFSPGSTAKHYNGGRLIPKYQNGSAYLKIKDDKNYWNNYLANTGYKPVYNENNSTWDDYYKLYGKAFFDKLYNLFGGEVPRKAFITNPLVNTARKRNFSIWWKNNNFGAMLPSALKSGIKDLNMIPFINISIPPYEGNDTLYHITDPHSYRSGYDGSSGYWIKKGGKPNSDELLNPHLHKKGGIIKAAQGWRIENNRLIVKQQGNEFFVNPEGFYVNGSGRLMARAYTSNGKQFDIPITTFDRNRLKLLGVNYIPRGKKKVTIRGKKKVTIIKSTYEAPSPNNNANKDNTIPRNNTNKDNTILRNNTTSGMNDNQLLEALKVLFNPILEQLNNRPSWYNGFNPQAGKNYTLKDGQMVEVTKPEEPDKNAAPALTSKAPSYQDLQTQNTQAFLNNSKNPNWRKNFRQNFMSAFNSGTLYNANNPEVGGNQVFDLLGMNAADIMGNERYWNDNKGGLYRGGMRRLARDYRKGRIGNGDIATKKNAFLAKPANNGGPALTNVDPSIVGVNVNAILDSSTNYENAYAESLKWNQAYYDLMQLEEFLAPNKNVKNPKNQ